MRGGKAGLLIRKHDHYTSARKMRRGFRALTAHTRECKRGPREHGRGSGEGGVEDSAGGVLADSERWPFVLNLSLSLSLSLCIYKKKT